MIVSVNEVAKRLKITTRAVQIKCNKAGLVKIGNQYQITQELAEIWYNAAVAKPPERTEHTKATSHPNRKNTISFISFVVVFLILVISGLVTLSYFSLTNQIIEGKQTIKQKELKENIQNKEIENLNRKLYDANDMIKDQRYEIQTLKFKDSLRIIKKW